MLGAIVGDIIGSPFRYVNAEDNLNNLDSFMNNIKEVDEDFRFLLGPDFNEEITEYICLLDAEEKVMNEVNGLLYHSPTVSDYISSVIGSIDDDYVRDFNNRLLNESNIMNIINQTKNNGLKSEKHSEADKKKKVL